MNRVNSVRLEAACRCETGKVRLNNEDNFYFAGAILPMVNTGMSETLTCSASLDTTVGFGVFDGMGGEQKGELAAFLAADTLRKKMKDDAVSSELDLQGVCLKANRRICDAALQYGGMRIGSTAAMVVFEKNHAFLCNIGDSKVFRLRGGILEQRSVDHTDKVLLDRQGIRNRKPRLTQHLGIFQQEMLIEPHASADSIQMGDHYLLCSDGLTDMLTEGEILPIIRQNTSVKDIVDQLVNQAMSQGGRDNITVLVCRL